MTFYPFSDPSMSEKTMHDIKVLCNEFQKYNKIGPEKYEQYHVKRGLRNSDGTGVMAGLTQICNVHGYVLDEGEKSPVEGRLTYRGIDINDLINGCKAENRYGYEEVVWLLLFGTLPTDSQLKRLRDMLASCRELPQGFSEDMILKAPSPNIMNKLARSVLALYSYDSNADDTGLENLMRQAVELIARMPTIMVHVYQVKKRYYDRGSMVFHPINPEHSTAQCILATLRDDQQFTEEEAHLLDLCLMLHAEHGGGNNSTFACRVLSSSGTDTYSAIAAGIGSLKGPKHGGANIKVMEMLEYLKQGVSNWEDDDEIAAYLRKMLNREVGDRSGLIYGIGHAVYTLSDPRAVILHANAEKLANERGFGGEFRLLNAVERLAPQVFAEKKGNAKQICANVDLYSGLVYKMLGIPLDLFTPLFAVSRVAGWCAHRIEEITIANRIIRPAYKSVNGIREYLPLNQRFEE